MQGLGSRVGALGSALFGRCFASCVPPRTDHAEDKELVVIHDEHALDGAAAAAEVDLVTATTATSAALDAADAAQNRVPPLGECVEWRWDDHRLSDELADDFLVT